MEHFEYEYDQNPKKRKGGRGALIVFLIILIAVAFVVGALSRDYFDIFPDRDEDLRTLEEPDSTEVPAPTVAPTLNAETPQPTQDSTSVVLPMPYADIPTIVERVSNGVVSITSYHDSTSSRIEEWEPMAYGTGVIISSDGYIVTNNHVIADAAKVSVTLYSGEKIVAELIGSDKYVDLAVLKIEKDDLYTIPFGDSSISRVGEQVIAIGSPLGDELTGTVTSGIISAVDRQIEVDGIPFNLLQTDAAVNPGNSGGPLVNMNGEVIGINTLKSVFAGYDEYGMAIAAEGISYAIPSNNVQASINDILEYGGIVRPFIGVYGNDVADNAVYDSRLPDGFVVSDLVENSPAMLGGIQIGDVIIAVEDKEILGFTDLYTIINSYKIGDTLTFRVYRPETQSEVDLEITLASNQEFK